MFWLGAFCGAVLASVALGFVLALCRVAADSDDDLDRMRRAGL